MHFSCFDFRSSASWKHLGMLQHFKTVTPVGLQCTTKSTFLLNSNCLEVGTCWTMEWEVDNLAGDGKGCMMFYVLIESRFVITGKINHYMLEKSRIVHQEKVCTLLNFWWVFYAGGWFSTCLT